MVKISYIEWSLSAKQSNDHGSQSSYANRCSCAYEPDEGLILGSALQEIADTVEQVYEQAIPRVRDLKRSESDGVKLYSYIHTQVWRCTYKVSWVAD